MPGVSYLGANCTGHGCFPARANDQASEDVFVGNIAVHRKGDTWETHECGDSSHSSTLSSGSSTVYVNNKQCSRIGDPVECGSVIADGSSTVICG